MRELALCGWEVIAPTHTELNISDTKAVSDFFATHTSACVINAAAHIGVDASELDPLPAWQVNALGAGNVARALMQGKHTRTKLIQVSTNYVFGDAHEQYTENDRPDPINVYGTTKKAGEELVENYCRVGTIPYAIIRTSWLYSPLRETYVDKVATTILRGEVFQAADTHWGNLTSARDLASAIVASRVTLEEPSGRYHMVNSVAGARGGVSRYGIAICIADTLGVPRDLIKKGDTPVLGLAVRPRHAILVSNMTPTLPPWEESLRSYLHSRYQSPK